MDVVRRVCVVLFLFAVGCGSAQRVAECTVQDSQLLADDFASAIWDDVRRGRRSPSKFLTETWAGFVAEFGVAAVRCSLEELIREWSSAAQKSPGHQAATLIAAELRDSL